MGSAKTAGAYQAIIKFIEEKVDALSEVERQELIEDLIDNLESRLVESDSSSSDSDDEGG